MPFQTFTLTRLSDSTQIFVLLESQLQLVSVVQLSRSSFLLNTGEARVINCSTLTPLSVSLLTFRIVAAPVRGEGAPELYDEL